MKRFRLAKEELQPLATGRGACFASDQITVDGYPVRFMYREAPDHAQDSGWRFLSGFEDEAYLNDAERFELYDVNTIANYDPSIVAHLDAPAGTAFEKPSESEVFVEVDDWAPPEE